MHKILGLAADGGRYVSAWPASCLAVGRRLADFKKLEFQKNFILNSKKMEAAAKPGGLKKSAASPIKYRSVSYEVRR